MANRITPHEARTIAAAAFCDPRSVVKALEGKPLAALTLTRIKNALAQLGRVELLPAKSTNNPTAGVNDRNHSPKRTEPRSAPTLEKCAQTGPENRHEP